MSLPTGKIIGENIDAYHSADAVSHSKLEVYRRRPELYRRMYVDKSVQRDGSEAFDIGSALHCAVLEPQHYSTRFPASPFDTFQSSAAKAWKAQQICSGAIVLSDKNARKIPKMRDAILAHRTASSLLTGGEAEVSWRMKFPGLPVPLQCRTDYFAGHVVDLKTTESLDDEGFRTFENAFVKFGYHRQAAWYMSLLADCGVTCRDFYFVVVEKNEPFGVAVYKPTMEAIEIGCRENQTDLLALAQSYKSNTWFNTPEEVHEIGVPKWYVKKVEDAA
jgi:hypothetical protein